MYTADLNKVPMSTMSHLSTENSTYVNKQVGEGTFWEILCIQLKIYPQTSFEPKYSAFYSKNYEKGPHFMSFLAKKSIRVEKYFSDI